MSTFKFLADCSAEEKLDLTYDWHDSQIFCRNFTVASLTYWNTSKNLLLRIKTSILCSYIETFAIDLSVMKLALELGFWVSDHIEKLKHIVWGMEWY